MPPIFKKAKEYDPELASKTLGTGDSRQLQQQRSVHNDNKQLLIELGLAEESDEDSELCLKEKQAVAVDEQTDGIAAYYPSRTGSGVGKGGVSRIVEKLRSRLEGTMQKLQAGRPDEATTEEVQELLFDQQHQIELLLRGNFSLRGSMDSIRRSRKEVEDKTVQLQQELEQQHGAALREMEGKLERAIQQVQQLQQATRDRQQQQDANAQQALQAANREVVQLREKVEELQTMLQKKNEALVSAQQQAGNLTSQVASLSAVSTRLEEERAQREQQVAAFRQELQELAAACSTAQQEAESRVAALQQAHSELSDLKQQLSKEATQHKQLRDEHASVSQQLQAVQTAGEQQATAASACAQQLESTCSQLQQQLGQLQVDKQSLLSQLAELTKQHQEMTTKQEALQQQLEMAEQLNTELQMQSKQLEESKLELHNHCQAVDAQLAAAAAAAEQQQAAATSSQQETAKQQDVLIQQRQALQQQIQQLESEKCSFVKQQQAMQQQVQQLELEKGSLKKQMQQADEHAGGVQQELQQTVATLQEQLKQAKAHSMEMESKLHVANRQQREAADKLAAQEADSTKMQLKVQTLQMEHQKALRTNAEQMQQMQDALNQAQAAAVSIQAQMEEGIAAVQQTAAVQYEDMRLKWRSEFDKRRKLHDMVVELKGNIRVLARIRPLIEKEHSSSGGADEAPVRVIDEETVSVAGPTTREFEFDRVFAPEDGQGQVFGEVSSLVTSILDGYNVCIMAYGQTGSGKTYTIEGPAHDPGVNSRALAELFRAATDRSADFKYTFSASVLEIYNEQIFDLLAGSRDTGDKLDIKEGPQGLFIPGLRSEPVGGAEDVTSVLQKGKQNRSTFATNMNEHSSRSHLVLTIYVKATDNRKGTTLSAKMHLIDLAGSERVSRSGAEGERLKEAAAINKSLSALGDVVSALQQRSSHVPYRNSKLTRLLEDSLGGSSKTLMIVNCSPAAENVNETKCSLEFAARARKVELGAAQRNISTTDAPSSPAGSCSGAFRTPDRASQLSTGSGSPGGTAANSPRVNRSGGDLSSTARMAASRRAAGLQQ